MEENNQNNVVTTPVVENVQGTTPVVDQPKKKKKVLPIILIVIAILFLVFLIVYFLFFAPEKNKTELDLSLKEQENAITGYGQALESAIDLQYNMDQKVLTIEEAKEKVHNENSVKCSIEGVNEDRTVYLSECSIKNYPVKYTYGTKMEKPKVSTETSFIVYYDESLKKASLEKFAGAKEYVVDALGKYSSVELLSNDGSLTYVRWKNEEANYKYVNYLTGESPVEVIPGYQQYSFMFYPIYGNSHYTEYAVAGINDYVYIYNYVTGKKVLETAFKYAPYLKISNEIPDNTISAIGDSRGIVLVSKDNTTKVVDYLTGNEVIQGDFRNVRFFDNYLIAYKPYNSFDSSEVYDYKLNRLYKDDFDKVFDIVEDKYILAMKDNHYLLVNKSLEVIHDFGENSEIVNCLGGYNYLDGVLFQMTKNDNGCIELIYSESNGAEVKKGQCGNVAKPILYFYPKKDINVKVTFDDPSVLETTYPKYNNGWEVLAKKDGSLYDKKGKYYYALYWDEEKVHTTDFSQGFYVTKDNAIDFLEEKLDIIGLNEKERNEFIMYWLPVLEKNKKSLVYFELTEERNSYSKININPKPDSMLRIVIHIKKVNKKTNIKEEKLVPFERNGFTVVEWGGTTY